MLVVDFSTALAAFTTIVCVVIAKIIASAWTPDLPVETLINRWAQKPSSFLSVWGLTVHIREVGTRGIGGPPVVLLHGTASFLRTWDGWASSLAASGRNVFSMDLPGFGLTGPYLDGSDYTIERYVDFVIAVLDAADYGSAPVVLVGNSLGGHIAYMVALRYPSRVCRLVLVDAAGTGTPWHRVPPAMRLTQVSRGSAWPRS